MRGFYAAMALGIATALLYGCGSGQAETSPERPFVARQLAVTLDGHFGPQNVAVSMAEKQGYFYDAGLLVSANTPLSLVRSIPYVVSGTDEVGISHQPEVELAKAKGAPITILGSLISQPTTAMIWLKKSKIDGVADLKGKTVGIPGLAFQERFLRRILVRAGLSRRDVKVRKVGYEPVPALVNGRVDALFGGYSNVEGVDLEALGLEPVVTGVESLGIPSYDELVVIARTDLAEEKPDLIRDFMAALNRGTAAAVRDPRAAIEAIEASPSPAPETSGRVLKAEIEATLPLLSEAASSQP